jgi:AcrR family transcriptional regulator
MGAFSGKVFTVETVAPRPYRQRARADAAAEKTERIVAAAEELFAERLYDQVSLADIASRAGVGLQTLIRRFATKEELVRGVSGIVRGRIEEQRGEAPVGDVTGAVVNLVEHYEEVGDMILRLLAQEERVPAFAEATHLGRDLHREWVRRVFAPTLGPLSRAQRDLRLAQLVALCDVYTWKLLRRDQRLSRARTERAMAEMIEALLADGPQ